MSSFGTKKKGGDVALQLTFPDVTAAFVADEPAPYGYVGRAMFGKAALPVADDFQQRYHQEKSHYANMNAMNGVHNNARSDWLLRHNTFGYTQPHAHLGQRVFANPSLGNQADIYSARHDVGERDGYSGGKANTRENYPGWEWWFDFEEWVDSVAPWVGKYGWDMISMGAPKSFGPGGHYTPPASVIRDMGKKKAEELERILREKEKAEARQADFLPWERVGPRRGHGHLEGGVLRTAEGQKYGRDLLKARIKQLDAIEAGRPGVSEAPFGPSPYMRSPELPESPVGPTESLMIELKAKLVEIRGVYEENANFAQLQESVKAALGKTIVEAQRLLFRLAIDFTISEFNSVLDFLKVTERLARSAAGARLATATDNRLYNGVVIMLRYTTEMIEFVNRPRVEKMLKSQTVLKDLGVSSLEGLGRRKIRGGEEPKNIVPPAPKPQSGFDFSQGTQPFLPPPPTMVREAPELEPEMPEETTERQERRTPKPVQEFATRERGAKFTVDQRVKFGDRQGAYYGEQIGDRVPVAPVPVPITPDGNYVHPGSGYTRPSFPKFTVQKKPSNSLKPRRMAPTPKLPMFQDSAAGIFSAARLEIPKVTSVPARAPFSFTGGRKGLPKDLKGFEELAEKMKGAGHPIKYSPTSKLSSIRQTFIRQLKL